MVPWIVARSRTARNDEDLPMSDFTLPGFDLDAFVRATLAEDLGEGLPGGGRDVTSEAVIPADAKFTGVMDSRDPISVAGLPIAAAFFRALDPDCAIEQLVEDGAQVAPGTDLMRIEGNARALDPHQVGAHCSTRAKPCPGCACSKNTRCGWAAARTTAWACGMPR